MRAFFGLTAGLSVPVFRQKHTPRVRQSKPNLQPMIESQGRPGPPLTCVKTGSRPESNPAGALNIGLMRGVRARGELEFSTRACLSALGCAQQVFAERPMRWGIAIHRRLSCSMEHTTAPAGQTAI
jgi:hypothetical protein